MAKKSSSSAKKAVKKSVPAKAKPVAKKAVKAASKPAKKVATKPVKVAPAKGAKKVAAKPVAVAKVKPAAIKEQPKVKPAVMSKKAVEPKMPDVIAEEPLAIEDADSPKAEKASKYKPVRVEKGNAADEKAKWAELFKKYGKEKAVNYKMSDTFSALTPLQHKVLGWGFILSCDNDRLEVLFETGIRMLISNYKS